MDVVIALDSVGIKASNRGKWRSSVIQRKEDSSNFISLLIPNRQDTRYRCYKAER